MDHPIQIAYEDAQTLVQVLNRNMVALTTLLEGRLSPAEKKLVAIIFEAQVDLQLVLDKVEQRATAPAKRADTEDRKLDFFVQKPAARMSAQCKMTAVDSDLVVLLSNKVY